MGSRRLFCWSCVVLCAGLGNGWAWAQASEAGAEVQRGQREQIQQWQRQAQRPADLPQAGGPAAWLPPLPGEQPCVVLADIRIVVAGGAEQAAAPPVPAALPGEVPGWLGACVGAQSLQRLQANLQARLQGLGYITSSLQLPAQDLASGQLQFSLHWGRVGQVLVQPADAGAPLTHAPGMQAVAVQPGAPLNLRDVEHTLETLARLPSQSARFLIEPGSAPLVSDLRILVSPQKPWRASLGLDAGDIGPGRPWDVQAQLWVDAPLGWSDQLLLTASGTPQATGAQQARRHSVYALWSVPWGRHLLSVSASTARNSRSIAGGVGRFDELGSEDQFNLRWQATPWRGASWRTQLWAAWNERRGHSHVGGVELLSRRRVASELGVGATHWRRLACGEASLALEASHTLRLARVADFQNLQAPLPRQWRVQADWRCAWPWAVPDDAPMDASSAAQPPWTWGLSAWTQASERPFDGTDLLTLGSRWTVRGHNPAQALTGQRISVARLSAAAPGQSNGGMAWQAWLGWDVGSLDRPLAVAATGEAPSRSLQSAVLGLRWQAGPVTGELVWARATGAAPAPRHGQWQAQAQWWF